ncbi:hypothetical protein M3Y94_00778600 [Aphelenchoides besseyi]|nr:hypothetical protein M3Y94_00778600 [Aphelenchoides besseyi]
MSKEKVKTLIAERDKIDAQLNELQDLLKSHGVDMNTPLVDGEGFPIASLDIVTIRKAKHSIICLTNDRKRLTDEIESLLGELHESARGVSTKNEDVPMAGASEENVVHRTTNRPFLQVENVVYGSPAYYAGLKTDDLIIQCGPLHADNFKGLQHLGEVIKESVGKTISLTVLRESKVHRLTAQPGEWPNGTGIFGARFNVVHGSQF